MKLYIDNSNVIQIRGLRNAVTGNYVNNATASFTVFRNGSAISGGSAIAMTYIGGSNGNYFGVLPETADLSNAVHQVVITVDGGVNADSVWTITVRPTVRNT